MYRKQFIFLIQVIFFLLFANLFSVSAETIILKSGKQIKGEIVERTDSYIKIKVKDIPFPMIYYLDEVEQVEGKTSISSKDTAPDLFLDRPRMIERYLAKVRQYYLNEKYEEALLLLQKVIELDPNKSDYYVGLGILYCYLKKFENAISSFQKALKLQPNDPDIYMGLGIAYSSVGSREKSKANLLKAIKYYKEDKELDMVNIFLVHFFLEKIDKGNYGKN